MKLRIFLKQITYNLEVYNHEIYPMIFATINKLKSLLKNTTNKIC